MDNSAEDKTATIMVKRHGSLLVTNVTTLINSRGEKIETKEVFSLCRCGGSKNKPFCDGDHKTNGFMDDKN
jgi:CDGSH-type Zn-finger protein